MPIGPFLQLTLALMCLVLATVVMLFGALLFLWGVLRLLNMLFSGGRRQALALNILTVLTIAPSAAYVILVLVLAPTLASVALLTLALSFVSVAILRMVIPKLLKGSGEL